jgi:4-amino-4-deoxy-L-arabinose transferase-like glycosyltransferase
MLSAVTPRAPLEFSTPRSAGARPAFRAPHRFLGLPIAIVLAFAAFLALRVWGLHFGSPPLMVHADEYAYAGQSESMGWSNLEPAEFENPALFTHALFLARQALRLLWGAEATEKWTAAGGVYVLARWIAAVLGALTPFLVGAAAKRLLGSLAAGIAAACVVGLSFLHGRDSHYGVNDVPATFLVALALWQSARALEGGGLRPLVLASVFAGLAAATKYNAAVAAALPLAALWLREDTRAQWRSRLGLSAVLGAISLAAFAAGNPFAVLDFERFFAGFRNQYSFWGDNYFWGQSREPGAWLYARASRAMLGFLHLGAVLAGAGLLLRRAPRTFAILAVFPVLYLGGMLTKTLFFWRFALPLLPFAAVFAAEAWTRAAAAIAGGAGRRWMSGAILAALLAVASIEPLAQLVRHDLLCTRPCTWLLARNWLSLNAPAGALVVAEGLPPRMPRRFRVLLPRAHIDKLRPSAIPGESQAPELEAGGYVVTDSFLEAGWQIEDSPDAERRLAVYRALREKFQLLAEFAPGPAGDPKPFATDMLYTPLVDLWSIERPGHTIRIYAVPPGAWGRLIPP